MHTSIKVQTLCAVLVSMLFVAAAPASATIAVTINGSGGGSVNSDPSGVISCTYPPLAGTCASPQTSTSPVTLTATPSGDSLFSGWGGSCAACPDNSCLITLESDKSCSATFTTLPPIRIAAGTPVYYGNLQEAFDAASNGTTIEARAVSFPGDVTVKASGRIRFEGGYDGSFANQSGYSMLQGSLMIRSSSVIADHLIISAKPALPPTAPVQLAAIPGDGQVTLLWDQVPGATSYNVYVSDAPGVTKTTGYLLADVPYQCSVTLLDNGVPYYFVVTAVNSSGESVESSEVSGTPHATQPAPGLIGVWGELSVSGTDFYNSSTGEWAPVSGGGTRIEFKPDGTYTQGTLIQSSMYNCSSKYWFWSAGHVSINGTVMTLSQTEFYKKVTDSCNSSYNYDGPLPLQIRSYTWSIEEVPSPYVGESWYTGPAAYTTLILDGGVTWGRSSYRRN
ncbi:MAG: hypothetical protein A2075_21285 [Geobacteraceae bacterium GWC2_58_44]|nr:MAG: hypothetical protein A2075_21285 [Geobacteraceae bacterium GWC2_58_44]HBG04586.1 hypothetical protein [Geobacter sp.]